MFMRINFMWQGHESKSKTDVSLWRNDEFCYEGGKEHEIDSFFKAEASVLMFDDSCSKSLANFNLGSLNVLSQENVK